MEIFLKADSGDIDSLDLTSMGKLMAAVNMYVRHDGDEISLSNQGDAAGWDLSSVKPNTESGITTISYTHGDVSLTLETTLQAEVDTIANEIVLSTGGGA